MGEMVLYRPDGSVIDLENVRQTRDSRYLTKSRVPYKVRTTAGVSITPDSALTISAVHACLRYLTQSLGKLPWRVKLREGTNNKTQDKHPLDYILSVQVSPEWTSLQFRETLLSWALRWGNGYAEIERSIDGRAIALWPLEPWRVEVMRDLDTQELYYRVAGETGSAGFVDMDAADIFHIRGFGEGPVGLSVMAYAAQSLGWVKAAQLFGAGFFGHGAQLAGVVKMKKALSPEGLAELRTEFQNLYGGPSKSNTVAFLDNEMEYQSIAIDPEKGQFIETNEYLLEEVCRWFGVPPHKIYNLRRATFSNIEHQSIEVVEDSLKPWAKRFELEADIKLFGQNRRGLFSEVDFTQLLQADTTTRMQYYQGLRNIGAISADEIRDREGFNAIGAEKGGDKFTMQAGMTTLEKIGEDPPAPVPAAPAGPAAAPEDPGDMPADREMQEAAKGLDDEEQEEDVKASGALVQVTMRAEGGSVPTFRDLLLRTIRTTSAIKSREAMRDKRLEDLAGELATARGDVTALQAQNVVLQAQNAELQAHTAGLADQLAEAIATASTATRDLLALSEMVRAEMASMRAEHQTAVTALQAKVTDLEGLEPQIRNAEKAAELMVAGVLDDIKAGAEQLQAGVKKVDRLEAAVNQVQARAEALEARAVEVGQMFETVSETIETSNAAALEPAQAALDLARTLERTLERTGEEVQAIDRRLDTTVERQRIVERELEEGGRRAVEAVSKLPKKLIIDDQGQLVYVTGEGELAPVGRVRGADGEAIIAAAVVGDELHFTTSGGKLLNAGKIPLAKDQQIVQAPASTRGRGVAKSARGSKPGDK